MNTNKIVLLAIAVVAIGIFALPSTVSLFSGQHSWYGLDTTGNDVPCLKCHGDIKDEMVAMDPENGVHKSMNLSCECHRVNGTGVASGDGTGSTPGTTSHAAETIACMVCHENNTRTGGNYPFAGGFNTTRVYDFPDPPTGDDIYNYSWGSGEGGEYAAHNDFIREAIKDDLMTDSNEACIACHTRIGVNISWTKSTTMRFNASETPEGVWELTNFTAHGTNETFSSYQNTWTNSY